MPFATTCSQGSGHLADDDGDAQSWYHGGRSGGLQSPRYSDSDVDSSCEGEEVGRGSADEEAAATGPMERVATGGGGVGVSGSGNAAVAACIGGGGSPIQHRMDANAHHEVTRDVCCVGRGPGRVTLPAASLRARQRFVFKRRRCR